MDKAKLETLLYNAIVWIEDECSDYFANEVDDEYKWFEQSIGITKEDLLELGITLHKGEIQ